MFFKKMGESCGKGKGKCCMPHAKMKIYCLGFIGAVVFYFQNSVGFSEMVMGLLKAIVWPAMLVYKLLGM